MRLSEIKCFGIGLHEVMSWNKVKWIRLSEIMCSEMR